MATKGTKRWEVYNKKTQEFLCVVTGLKKVEEVKDFCKDLYPNTPFEIILTKSKGMTNRYSPKKPWGGI